MDVAKELSGLSGSKEEQYKELFNKIEAAADVPAMITLCEYVVGGKGGDTSTVVKDVVEYFITRLNEFGFQPCVEIGTALLTQLSSNASSFERQINLCADCVATSYLLNRKFDEAIGLFARVKFEGMSKEFEAHVYVKVAQAELGNGNSDRADTFINKAGHLVRTNRDVSNNNKILLKYKVCYAQLRDANGQFLIAARHYYGLSQADGMTDRESPLRAACICAIVAPAGPMRNNMLSTLYKDERTSRFDKIKPVVYPVLEKMFMGKIVRPSELEDFKELLSEHHFRQNADGSTVFSRAIMDHNVLSAGKLYANISFTELATLLGIEAEEAESVASTMISEDRLKGAIIDQVDGFVTFPHVEEKLLQWDSNVDQACAVLNGLVDSIQTKHPHLIE
eukprot:TRINITY_DN585_c0_g1_i1.p1 TRINITY_DN585_c0_g1~~TRINITY_DN585_c0_g1_i1.p1  ORF type:complete len:394 (-),score=180.74 TRINITY_DN585_c0_g1_i1:156-1337(-)